MTRPSAAARETLIPPERSLVPPLSVGVKDPDRESSSKRPWINSTAIRTTGPNILSFL
jgi:hypothetical protein